MIKLILIHVNFEQGPNTVNGAKNVETIEKVEFVASIIWMSFSTPKMINICRNGQNWGPKTVPVLGNLKTIGHFRKKLINFLPFLNPKMNFY